MLNFNLGSLAAWVKVVPGELMEFPIMPGSPRDCMVDFISDAPISVRAITESEEYLIAAGDGLMQVKFTIAEPTAVTVLAHKDTAVFMRTRVAAQVIPESQEPIYTSIEPRPAGPSEDIRLMQAIMRQNNLRNERLLAEQRAAYDDRLVELEGRLAPKPTPAPVVAPAAPAAAPADPADGGAQ